MLFRSLELPTQWSIHPVFHTDLLTPYRETPTHGRNYQRPAPELVHGEEEYEVKKVLDQPALRQKKEITISCQMEGISQLRESVGRLH